MPLFPGKAYANVGVFYGLHMAYEFPYGYLNLVLTDVQSHKTAISCKESDGLFV
jgi:hypothetical protein